MPFPTEATEWSISSVFALGQSQFGTSRYEHRSAAGFNVRSSGPINEFVVGDAGNDEPDIYSGHGGDTELIGIADPEPNREL